MTTEEYFNIGKELSMKEEYSGALLHFTKAIEINPKYSEAYEWRADINAEIGDYSGAIEDYTNVIKLSISDTNIGPVYHRRGIARSKAMDYSGAIEDYKKSIEMYGNDAEVYFNRGYAYEKLENTKFADVDYSKAIEIIAKSKKGTLALMFPNFIEPFYRRGLIRIEHFDFNGAIEDFTKALKFESDFKSEIYYCRGLAKEHIGDIDGANEDFNNADILKKTSMKQTLAMQIMKIKGIHKENQLRRMLDKHLEIQNKLDERVEHVESTIAYEKPDPDNSIIREQKNFNQMNELLKKIISINKKYKRKILIALAMVGVVLIITNPTPEDFKTYLYSQGKYPNNYGRESNFLIFSIYTFNHHSLTSSPNANHDEIKRVNESPIVKERHLGILKNFF